MLETAIIVEAIELLTAGSLWLKVRAERTRRILIFGSFQPAKIPILDHQLEKLVGCPSRTQLALSKRIVNFARKLVNTKAFEHVVAGLVNTKSNMHKKLQASTIVRIP